MSLETIEKIFSGLFSSGWVGAELDVCWHAGEPLVLPVRYYAEAFRVIERLSPDRIKVNHHFQTNGMMIDDEWCRFFNAHNAKIGVSIDGPEEINNANRLTRSGRTTSSKTMAGIRCLQRNNVEFSVISVLTEASLGKARELHDFYVFEGIKNVCFNVEEIEGSNATSSLSGRNKEIEFDSFMREFWNLTIKSSGLSYVREFRDMLRNIVRPQEGSTIQNTLVEPFATLSVDCEGNFTTFSPEFLGHDNAHYGNFIIGNFWTNNLEDSLKSDVFKRLSKDVAAGVELCRNSCEYFPICGGGSPVNKLYENGTVVSSETMYCRLNIKTIADIAMDIIDSSALQEIKADDGSSVQLPTYRLYILGTGIAFPGHLTLQTLEILRHCRQIYTNLETSELPQLPDDIRDKCISLWHLYQDKRPRAENYRDVTQAVVDAGTIGPPVAWLTRGHPRIFDSVSEALIEAGRLQGWNVYVAPAISSIDTILAELGYDPAGGLLIHEATALVAQRVPLVQSIATLLLQPGVFGTNIAHIGSSFEGLDLSPLRDHLRLFYGAEHRCAFIRSATATAERHQIFWVQLRDLASAPNEAVTASTLFLPAVEWNYVAKSAGDARNQGREQSNRKAAPAASPTATARPGNPRKDRTALRRGHEIPNWLKTDDRTGGSRIAVFLGETTDEPGRVEVSMGRARPPVGLGRRSYDVEAIVPREQWRPLTPSERDVVVACVPPKQFGKGISVVRIPPSILKSFQPLRVAASQALCEEELNPWRDTALIKQGTRAIAGFIKRNFAQHPADFDVDQISGLLCVNPPGLPTITTHPETNICIGLHLDDWYSLPLTGRERAPNRICVNLGNEDRFFLFLNMPIAHICAALEHTGQKPCTDFGGTPIARAFMSFFPSYPILRVRIRPGEAYIAPTESIVHDASSLEMATMDVTLHIRGEFRLSAAVA